jgi:hypothetical protein
MLLRSRFGSIIYGGQKWLYKGELEVMWWRRFAVGEQKEWWRMKPVDNCAAGDDGGGVYGWWRLWFCGRSIRTSNDPNKRLEKLKEKKTEKKKRKKKGN